MYRTLDKPPRVIKLCLRSDVVLRQFLLVLQTQDLIWRDSRANLGLNRKKQTSSSSNVSDISASAAYGSSVGMVKIRATADSASMSLWWLEQGAVLRSFKYFLLLATSHIQYTFKNRSPETRAALWPTNIVSSHFFCPAALLFFFCTVLLSFLQFSCQNDEAHGASFFSLHHVDISNS